ncbi:hypothetical protein [Nonomuraea gerenzanensis]|uniref:hypothetical protein n=1 Tax=Nonomuraea gerenzanensis TaxID=93944 RepID=UPI001CD936BD|nr:hypothetical protein [Nonomuraea gerenzanensis]UBU16622.1 hypothetical protein LCN96_16875 [Nonomuraea gerenzanensis]
MGALPRLTRYVIAFAAAGLILSASSIAYADDVIPAPEPTVTVTAPTPAQETDPAAEAPSPTPALIDTPVESAPNSHTGGM